MRRTGRTAHLFINIKPELKKVIAEKQKQGFNVSEYFEVKIMKDLNSLEQLQKEREMHLKEAQAIDDKIAKLMTEEQRELEMNLNNDEVQQLATSCDPLLGIRKQRVLFNFARGKEVTMKEFSKLKEKYIGGK